jgi:1-acyl-sn-glycerol-3-phosphate acyltransferase
MIALLILAARSSMFYLGYYLGTIAIASCFIVSFPLLSQQGRYRFASLWCGFIINWLRLTCNVKYQVLGMENIPSGPVVIFSNHQSEWETIFLYPLVFPVSPILKKELMAIPFWGWAMRLQKPIAIDRSNPREASKSLLTQGVARIRDGYSVIVFPEGTRMGRQDVKRFSRGGAKLAIAAQATVLPIAHNAGYCWPPRRFLKHPGVITVVIGCAVSTEGMSASELTDDIEAWIRLKLAEMIGLE